ncbi:hypothetical protein ACWOFR_15740 [Carnobacterium gallinarum]|uniref:hypothetical protein n=1 Tax=Carnobacterium gallinarum TaxID=2749 RepID=UPI000553B63B|nr:hypothetical protein [Carnobacterium gallinarum]
MNNDASASWHGFEYQGKVTLYQVLKRINCLLEEGKQEEISRYSFLVEGEEDFDILEDGEIIELNQVKAQYSKQNISGYMDSVMKLYARSSAQNNETIQLKFHSVVEIADWDRKFEERYLNELEKLKKKHEENKLTSGDTEIYQYLQTIPYDKVKEKICLEIYDIENQRKQYCPSDVIEKLLEEEIVKNFELNNQAEKADDAEKYKITLFFFIGDHIRKRASNDNENKVIEFFEIQECITKDDVLIPKDKYLYAQIVNRLCNDCLVDYCKYNCDVREQCQSIHKCYLKPSLFNTLKELDLNEAVDVIRKMFPHVVIKDYFKDNYKIDESGLNFIYDEFSKSNFYDLLKFDKNNKQYSIAHNNKKTYFPTGIVGEASDVEKYKDKFNENIDTSVFDVTKIYEVNYLITKNLETGINNQEAFFSERLDVESDFISEELEEISGKEKRNQYIINLRKIDDVREDLISG